MAAIPLEVGWPTQVLAWLTALSLATLVLSAVAFPFAIVRLPADFFLRREQRWRARRDGEFHWAAVLVRRVSGTLLVVAGVAMLVLPGQGVLAILLGLVLVDLPGTRRIERFVLERTGIVRVLDWIRTRAGREPFQMGDARPPDEST